MLTGSLIICNCLIFIHKMIEPLTSNPPHCMIKTCLESAQRHVFTPLRRAFDARVMSPVTSDTRPRTLPATIMARKKPQVPLRQHYSRDLKRRVIHLSHKLHMSSTEIAMLLDMPLRVVQRVRQVWNEIGEVSRQGARSGRSPLMSRAAVDVRSHYSC